MSAANHPEHSADERELAALSRYLLARAIRNEATAHQEQSFHVARIEEQLWNSGRIELAVVVHAYRKALAQLRSSLVRDLAGRLEAKVG